MTTGTAPSDRSTPAVATLGSSIYLFGGVKDDFAAFTNTFYNDLYRFDTQHNRWTELSPSGALPPPRAFAAATADKDGEQLLVFGGSLYDPTFTDFLVYGDLWAYAPAQGSWQQLSDATTGPGQRSRPNMWVQGDIVYVFGGITPYYSFMNDLWAFDLTTGTWSELIPDGAAGSPPGRHEAQTSSSPHGSRVIVYGGENIDFSTFQFQTLGDTWELDLDTLTWADVTPAADITPPRNYGAAASKGGSLYLHGGDTPGGSAGCGAPFAQNPSNELWVLDLQQHTWTQRAPGGDPLPSLKRSVASPAGGNIYFFSGFDFDCPTGEGQGQIWNTDVFVYKPNGK